MDVASPEHLERFRRQRAFKAVLLLRGPQPGAAQARFERASKNTLYWPVIDGLASRFFANGRAEDVLQNHVVYGRACWLLATTLSPSTESPFAIAVAAADDTGAESLVAVLQSVSRDYWFGSYFFK